MHDLFVLMFVLIVIIGAGFYLVLNELEAIRESLACAPKETK